MVPLVGSYNHGKTNTSLAGFESNAAVVAATPPNAIPTRRGPALPASLSGESPSR
jgi:hypothetical protein